MEKRKNWKSQEEKENEQLLGIAVNEQWAQTEMGTFTM